MMTEFYVYWKTADIVNRFRQIKTLTGSKNIFIKYTLNM